MKPLIITTLSLTLLSCHAIPALLGSATKQGGIANGAQVGVNNHKTNGFNLKMNNTKEAKNNNGVQADTNQQITTNGNTHITNESVPMWVALLIMGLVSLLIVLAFVSGVFVGWRYIPRPAEQRYIDRIVEGK